MKFIDTAWYVVFDGTSYYGLLGVDVEAEQDEDPDLSVEKGATVRRAGSRLD